MVAGLSKITKTQTVMLDENQKIVGVRGKLVRPIYHHLVEF